MKPLNLAILIITLIFYSCNQSGSSDADRKNNKVGENSCADPGNSDIYNFLKVVISDKGLDTTYGLEEAPLRDLNSVEPDSVFLQKHLLPESLAKKKNQPPSNVFTIGKIDSCLTQEDIKYMLVQKKSNVNFKWNSKCVNLKNKNKFDQQYAFSVPLFSVDKTKFIITIENYSAGGIILLYKKQNKSWSSIIESRWIH